MGHFEAQLYADIAFYMAHVFGARMGAPMTERTPRFMGWRDRITARPAVRRVIASMAAYLASQGRPLPAFMAGDAVGGRGRSRECISGNRD